MLYLVVPGLLGVFLFAFYVTALLLMYYMRARFFKIPQEVGGIAINGIIGVVGFVLYSSNLPVVGAATPLPYLYTDCSFAKACHTQWMLVTYSFLSTVRFLCWYAEFLTSFLFIAVFFKQALLMTLLRYTFHGLNLSLSLATLALSSTIDFPSHEVLGGTAINPFIVQALLCVFVLFSFYFIATSPLYRVNWPATLRAFVPLADRLLVLARARSFPACE